MSIHTRDLKAVKQYLSNYAEPISVKIAKQVSPVINKHDVMVIPAYQETSQFIKRLSHHPNADNILLITVINEPDEDSTCTISHTLYTTTQSDCNIVLTHERFFLGKYEKLSVLAINCLGEFALPKKQGVGLARKIGADIATHLIFNKCIQCSWIYCSDADVTFPNNYFQSNKATSETKHAALVFNFKHVTPNTTSNDSVHQDIFKATQIYEAQIRYYRDQLEHAGSPYAFFTLGSCMAVSMPHYAKVRGFPKRSAGEDFYLLNKLAKLNKIIFLVDTTINIQARLSTRVPFGTGPATERILQRIQKEEAIYYYNPKVFQALAIVLKHVDWLWYEHDNASKKIGLNNLEALNAIGFQKFISTRLQQDKSLETFQSSFMTWFDAFKTLKFLHYLQSNYYPDTPFNTFYKI